jgi:UPF0716 protein FxsA
MTLIAGLLMLPLVEIAGFVIIGPWLGVVGTLAAVLLSAILGIAIIRSQGMTALDRIHTAMAKGETPVRPMVDGVLVLLAGVLFILPGFFSDLIALLLLVPMVRRAVAEMVVRLLRQRNFRRRAQTANAIEGELREVAPDGEIPPPVDTRWGRH